MPIIDLIIKNGRIVTSFGVVEAGIGINKGKIVAVAKDVNLPRADKVIDVDHNFVLPGIIDAHVHFREPGSDKRETFVTGTKAAASGGVTTVFEMPVSNPAVSSAEVLEKRKRIVNRGAIVDFALYGGAGMHNIDEIQKLAKAGVIGFKTFMHGPPKGRETEYKGTYVINDGYFFDVLQTVAGTRLPHSIHAENNAIINFLTEKLKKAGRKDALAHAESRPNFVEAEAVSKVIILAKIAGTHVHIAHLSTREGVQIIKQAKNSGQLVTVETCPHYLLLTAEAMKKLGPYAKINPPLRSEKDVKDLWMGVNSGTIDIIVSDHAPFMKEEKEAGWKDIWRAQSGSPTVENMLPLLLTKVNEGKISLERLVQVTSEMVARIFGIYPKKGVIQVGSDADLVVIDLDKKMMIEKEKMFSNARDLTIYDGWEVRGYPIMTIVRGEIVMKEGKIFAKPGYGKFISPSSINKLKFGNNKLKFGNNK